MRAFIAIEIPKDIKAKLSNILKESEGMKKVEKKNMHITISFLGEINDEKCVANAMNAVFNGFGKFKLIAKGMGAFPNEKYIRVVWAGVENGEKIEEMSKKINDFLRKNCKINAENEKTPHITLARIKHYMPVADILKTIKENDKLFGEWEVEKVVLKKSVLTPSGPIYEVIKEVKL